MARPKPPTYEVRHANKPFKGNEWKVVGYKGETRKQHWFPTKEKAEKDAGDRNLQLAKHGESLDLSWKPRWLRHSFISYLYFKDRRREFHCHASRKHSGHRAQALQVTGTEAKKFWAIRP